MQQNIELKNEENPKQNQSLKNKILNVLKHIYNSRHDISIYFYHKQKKNNYNVFTIFTIFSYFLLLLNHSHELLKFFI